MSAEPWPGPLLPQAGGLGEGSTRLHSERPGPWTPGRSCLFRRYAGAVSRTVIVSAVRTPFGRLGGGLEGPRRDRARRDRDPRRPRARRRRAGSEVELRDHGPGAPGRRRPGARAPGRGRRRHPDGSPRGHDQQGLRVVDPRRRDRRLDDPRRRRRGRRHRRHGVDVERAVHAQAGPLRLPARRRDAHRPDDARRPHLVLRQAAHGRAGVVRLPRARHLARGPGPLGRSARTSAPPPRRTPAASTTRSSPSATSPPTRASAATRRTRSSPPLKPVFDRERHDHRGERARRERRRVVRRRLLRGVRAPPRARAARDDRRAGLRRRRLRVPRAHAGEGRRDGARARRQDDRRREARRDQRGVRVRRAPTRPACSAPTRRS